MRSLSVDQVREADRRAIEDLGIPSVVLMDHAGRSVFRELDANAVGVVCGKGNNGGDGFVVARYAIAAGWTTRVVLVASPDEITGDAAIFMRSFQRLGGAVVSVSDPGAVKDAILGLSDCPVLVDALLGTGIAGEVRGPARTAIDAWPAVPTVAVDTPSGLNADTGEICGACIRAAKTVTFQFRKRGFDDPGAAQYLGEVVVADIGIPPVCADDDGWAQLQRRK